MPTAKDVEIWMDAAQGMGFSTIICFLEDRKLAKWYGGLYENGLLGRYKQRGFTVFHFPVEDYQPVPDDVRKQSLEAFVSVPKPVVLQDSGGASRTGAVARYIVEQLSRRARGA